MSSKLAASHFAHLLYALEHRRRTDRAIEPDHVRAPLIELLGKEFRRRSVAGAAIGLNRHLRDDRQIAQRADGEQRLLY